MSAPLTESVHSTARHTWSKGEQRKWLGVAALRCNSGLAIFHIFISKTKGGMLWQKKKPKEMI
jgi:hypothetical protein